MRPWSRRPGAKAQNRGRIPTQAGAGGLTIPAPVFWVDASDGASFTQSAGTITSLTNKASGVAMTLNVAPGYSATAANWGNGAPGFTFNGTTQYVTTTEAAVVAAFTNSAPHTIIAVVQPATFAAQGAFISAAPIAQSTAFGKTKYFATTNAGTGKWTYRTIDDAVASIQRFNNLNNNNVANRPSIAMALFSGTTIAIQVDSDAATMDNSALVPATTISPGRVGLGAIVDVNPDTFFSGVICEILVYASALTQAQYISIQAELAIKWGASAAAFVTAAFGTSNCVGNDTDVTGFTADPLVNYFVSTLGPRTLGLVSGTHGAELTAANAIAADQGKPVHYVKHGLAGSVISQYLESGGAQWANISKAIDYARLRGPRTAAVYLIAGENDGTLAGTTQASYLASMKQFAIDVRNRFYAAGCVTRVRFFILLVNNRWIPIGEGGAGPAGLTQSLNMSKVRAAQLQFVAEDPDAESVNVDAIDPYLEPASGTGSIHYDGGPGPPDDVIPGQQLQIGTILGAQIVAAL